MPLRVSADALPDVISLRQARPDEAWKLLPSGMAKFRTTLAAMLWTVCASATAQTPGMGDTREVPPEKKAAPAPEHRKSQTDSGTHELKRCEEYSGMMREDCLRGLRNAEGAAAAGTTRRPEPPTAPPPNNPR